MKGSSTLHMAAAPEKIWALVSDVTRIGEFSPETLEGQWLNGATGPAAGVRFRGHVKRNGRPPMYWTTCEVVACDSPREFAFAVLVRDKAVNTWRYVLVAADGGTDVTESFELANTMALRLYWRLLGWARAKTNSNGMRTTLERIKAVVEG